MSYNTAIFDLDDTLATPSQEFEHSWTRKCLQEFTSRPFSDGDISAYLKRTIPDREEFLRKLGFANSQQYLDMWLTEDAIRRYVETMHVFPESKILSELKSKGVKLGLVTSGDIRRVSKQIDKLESVLGAKNLFDCITTIHGSSFSKKPEPEALLYSMAQLAAEKGTTFYCGNNEDDIEMARRAKIKPVKINRCAQTNFNSDPIVVNSLSDLIILCVS